MFNLNYCYQINELEYKGEYPEKSIDSNFFFIKGPNDAGKTTALEMLTLCFLGAADENIEFEKRNRIIKRFIETDNPYNIDIKITSNANTILVRKEKCGLSDNFSFIYNDDEKNMDFIKDNYQVIYLSPDSPEKRIREALNTVVQKVNSRIDTIQRKNSDIYDAIKDIERYNNAITNQKYINEQINILKHDNDQYQCKITENEAELEKYQKADEYIKYRFFLQKKVSLESDLKEIQKNLEIIDRSKQTKSEQDLKKYDKNDKEFRELKNKLYAYIKDNIQSNKQFKEIMTEQNIVIFDDIKNTLIKIKNIKEVNKPSDFNYKKQLESINIHIDYESKKYVSENKHNIEEMKFVTELLTLLRNYRVKIDKLPGTDYSIELLIQDLEKKKRDIDEKCKIEQYPKLKKDIENIIDSLSYLENLVKETPIPSKQTINSYSDLSQEESRIRDEIRDIYKKINTIDESKFTEEIKEIATRYGDTLITEINNIRISIDAGRGKIEGNKNKINAYLSGLESINTGNITSYKLDLDELKNLYDMIDQIINKLKDFQIFLSSLSNSNKDIILDENNDNYNRLLGKYFANIIKYVYYNNMQFELGWIDLHRGQYITKKEELHIDFFDMGGGHSGANAILHRLKIADRKKKKIVLIDESSEMTCATRAPIIEEIKSQIRSGDIILGLIVLPDDGQKSVYYEPICDDING